MLIKQLINFTTIRRITQIPFMTLSTLQKKPTQKEIINDWSPLIEVLRDEDKILFKNITAPYLTEQEK